MSETKLPDIVELVAEASWKAARKWAGASNREWFEMTDWVKDQWRASAQGAIDEITRLRAHAGWHEAIEEAACCALEQRCERGTPWDLACTTIATAIRALLPPGGRTEEKS